ncbi:MAG: aminotransferase class V-fold PLP-dependent enzyme [Candidatus Omnitrophota bacterium]
MYKKAVLKDRPSLLNAHRIPINQIRSQITGLEKQVPLINRGSRPYINFDNAATTPSFKSVIEKVAKFSEWYASVHRGTGFKSQLSTHIYENCREKVMQFVGADTKDHVAIFTSNTTCAINNVCQHIELKDNEVILVTIVEHHSNMLPWRVNCPVEYVDMFDSEGNFSSKKLEEKLRTSQKKVRLVAITGASNVTGCIPPIKEVSRVVHNYGAELLVDAAQLIACRPVEMLSLDSPERIDYLVFSAHKMYAPFGVGVIVGPRKTFISGRPYMVGGGTVDLVTLDDIEWTDAPERDEPGTPNLIGVVALIEAIDALRKIGWDFIVEHNRFLTKKLLEELRKLPKITIYGKCDPDCSVDRAGVVTFNAQGISHALLAAILGYEWGIGVRNGCFCAQPYVIKLLGLDQAAVRNYAEQIREGDWSTVPGMVRASFGIYNTEEEIDYFIEALTSILNNGTQVSYTVNPQTGEYSPEGKTPDFNQYFSV